VLLGASNFASGLAAPTDYKMTLPAPDVTLSPSSAAVDRGLVLPNVNDGYTGKAPDLGAVEIGCPSPIYGVRPEGMDETNEPLGCTGSGTGGGSSGTGGAGNGTGGSSNGEGGAGGGGGSTGAKSGCGCRVAGDGAAEGGGALAAAAILLAVGRRRARRGR
jgi:MYXO-CTERM domain-containing protein